MELLILFLGLKGRNDRSDRDVFDANNNNELCYA